MPKPKQDRIVKTGKVHKPDPIPFDEKLLKEAEKAVEKRKKNKKYYKKSGKRWSELDESMQRGSRVRLVG